MDVNNLNDIGAVVAAMANGLITPEQATARLATLASNKANPRKSQGPAKVKISPKGCISVYAGGQYPTSAYPEQWKRILAVAKDIEAKYAEAEPIAAANYAAKHGGVVNATVTQPDDADVPLADEKQAA